MTMADPARVVLVGGGVHVATLADELAARVDLPDRLTLVLVARDAGRLATIGTHVAARARAARPGWKVEVSDDLADAARDAAAVVLMVRVGGLSARAGDEGFPADFGLVGDEGLGPGGMANALRTVPVVRELGTTLARVAPDALVVNLVAPLPVTTRALVDVGVRAVGVCELPTVVRDRLVAAGLRPDAGLGLGGLNHLSFWWDHDEPGRLRDAALAAGLVDAATWDRFGAVPMPYYFRVIDPVAGAGIGIRQPSGRAGELQELADRALDAMAARPGDDVAALAGRPTPWFDLAVVPVVAAHLGGSPWSGPLNLPNAGRFAGVADDVVVEAPGGLADGVLDPGAAVELPPAVGEATRVWAAADDLLHRATRLLDADDHQQDAADALAEALALVHPELPAEERPVLAARVVAAAGRAPAGSVA
ncbi:MAG: hypothetical protein ACOYOP_01630 [Microthrixaceae bacterium]